MKRHLTYVCSLVLLLAAGSSQLRAQFGPGGSPSGPQLNPEMIKLFGEHKAFSADLMFEMREGEQSDTMTIPATIAFQDGNTRFELDLASAKGGRMPPGAAAQLKQMGMDKMVTISLPEKKVSYLIYPGLTAYAELPLDDAAAGSSVSDLTMDVTELGKETIDGHECVKNKVVVTNKEGEKQESTVWNAVDLKEFPIKIAGKEQGNDVVLTFKEVKLVKPPADRFSPPSDYTKYDNMMTMMQQEVMKRMGGGQAPAR